MKGSWESEYALKPKTVIRNPRPHNPKPWILNPNTKPQSLKGSDLDQLTPSSILRRTLSSQRSKPEFLMSKPWVHTHTQTHPKPLTLNPQPWTLSPYTVNLKTRNPSKPKNRIQSSKTSTAEISKVSIPTITRNNLPIFKDLYNKEIIIRNP